MPATAEGITLTRVMREDMDSAMTTIYTGIGQLWNRYNKRKNDQLTTDETKVADAVEEELKYVLGKLKMLRIPVNVPATLSGSTALFAKLSQAKELWDKIKKQAMIDPIDLGSLGTKLRTVEDVFCVWIRNGKWFKI